MPTSALNMLTMAHIITHPCAIINRHASMIKILKKLGLLVVFDSRDYFNIYISL